MNAVGMYYVGAAANLVFLILSIIGYFYVAKNTGNRLAFWYLFAAAWSLSFISYICLIFGVPSDAWYITLIRIFTYVFFLAAIASMFIELVKFKKQV